MTHAPLDGPDFPQRALVYWYKRPVLAIARPGALTYDGRSITCVDNEFDPVFGAPLAMVTVKRRFGVFQVCVDGRHVSYLSPIRGLLSPAPSERLLRSLDITMRRSSRGRLVEARGRRHAGRIRNRSAGDESVFSGPFSWTDAATDYVLGVQRLGRLFSEIGVWRP
ncbi:hypothetical protein [Microbacterium marinilacus]|uniref:Uncharacterized protein n=1 Tax=Microbacterium marinilacus TaxID=415209 RepID=A0ABP7B291_9MICO|nr:hypothetical protein [Microbacterium marinilacus]MBY0688698.1 hypothetical protein [Microbacterium marinilacus]